VCRFLLDGLLTLFRDVPREFQNCLGHVLDGYVLVARVGTGACPQMASLMPASTSARRTRVLNRCRHVVGRDARVIDALLTHPCGEYGEALPRLHSRPAVFGVAARHSGRPAVEQRPIRAQLPHRGQTGPRILKAPGTPGESLVRFVGLPLPYRRTGQRPLSDSPRLGGLASFRP
jgi:hypothetical protein